MLKSYKYKLKTSLVQIVLLNKNCSSIPICSIKLDRDLNTCKNILKKGYKLISSGIDDYRSRGEIRPTLVGTTDETSKVLNIYSEAQPSLVVG